jgi:hypothetical protein
MKGIIDGIPIPQDLKLARQFFDRFELLRNPNETAEGIESDWTGIYATDTLAESAEDREERIQKVTDAYAKQKAFQADLAASVTARVNNNSTWNAIAAGLSTGLATNAAVNQSLANAQTNINATVASVDAQKAHAALSTPTPAGSQSATPASTQGQQQQQASAQQQRDAARAACMAQPITPMRTAQTNPFMAHAQTFTSLLRMAKEKCANAKDWNAWQSCIGDNATGAFWNDESPADQDHSDLFRRYNAVASNYSGGNVCLNYSVRGTRSDCMLTSGTVEVVRNLCISRLQQAIDAMNCDNEMLPRVWAAENTRNDDDAKARRDADCKARYPQ